MAAPAAAPAPRGRGLRKPKPTVQPPPKPAARRLPLEHGLLMTATLCLMAGGAIMVYSASSARGVLAGQGDGTGYLIRYGIYGFLGLLIMRYLSRGGVAKIKPLTPLLLAGSFAALFLVLVPGFGVSVNGARRWLGAGPLQFQPSELMKVVLILYAAQVVAARPARLQTLPGLFNPLVVVAGVACLLVAAQPDLGTALVIGFTLFAFVIAGGARLGHIAVIGVVVALLVGVFALVEPYRAARLTAFVNPWAHAQGIGFQSVQGQIALGSGGLFGVGLGESVQKIFYLPEAHTDFILAVIGEELGVAGIGVLLALYAMLGYAGLRVARRARTVYEQLLAAGITSLILAQATLNIFAVLGLAPVAGVPLPFISYGSTNLLVLLAAMGLLLDIASRPGKPLRSVPEPTDDRRSRAKRRSPPSPDRGGRDGRARRARAGGGGRPSR
jgi:cell division protein FtsW